MCCFSKSKVLEVYSDFINNFNQAMELAKSESKRKSAFADFLKVKQITARTTKMMYLILQGRIVIQYCESVHASKSTSTTTK